MDHCWILKKDSIMESKISNTLKSCVTISSLFHAHFIPQHRQFKWQQKWEISKWYGQVIIKDNIWINIFYIFLIFDKNNDHAEKSFRIPKHVPEKRIIATVAEIETQSIKFTFYIGNDGRRNYCRSSTSLGEYIDIACPVSGEWVTLIVERDENKRKFYFGAIGRLVITYFQIEYKYLLYNKTNTMLIIIRWTSRRWKKEYTIDIHQTIETTAYKKIIEIETFQVCSYEPQFKNSRQVPGQTFSSFPFCPKESRFLDFWPLRHSWTRKTYNQCRINRESYRSALV